MAEKSWGERVTIVSGKLTFVLEQLSHIRFLIEKAFHDEHPKVDQLSQKIVDEICELLEMFSKEEHNRFHELFKAISNMSIDKVPFRYDPETNEYKIMKTSRNIYLNALLDIRDLCRGKKELLSEDVTKILDRAMKG